MNKFIFTWTFISICLYPVLLQWSRARYGLGGSQRRQDRARDARRHQPRRLRPRHHQGRSLHPGEYVNNSRTVSADDFNNIR